MERYPKTRNTKGAHVLNQNCKCIFKRIAHKKNLRVNIVQGYSKIQNFKNWLITLRALFVVPLNESAHRKSGHVDPEPVILFF